MKNSLTEYIEQLNESIPLSTRLRLLVENMDNPDPEFKPNPAVDILKMIQKRQSGDTSQT